MKTFRLALLLLPFVLQETGIPYALAEDSASLPGFLDQVELSGTLYSIYRVRDRKNIATGKYQTNLNHLTTQASVDFNATTAGGILGLELAFFGAYDIHNSGSPAHEMNFFPWSNPWNPDWAAEDADDKISIYKANIRLQGKDMWARLGYFQPQGPGVLGVNWSFLPGTYLGGEVGLQLGDLTLAASMANRYKAPWFSDIYAFRREDRSRVNNLWSVGARYMLQDGLDVELAYGESESYLRNAHLKVKYRKELEQERQLYLTGQIYAMDDRADDDSMNDLFNGTALHFFAAAHYSFAQWTLKLEGLHSHVPADADNDVGYFAYRMIGAYGGGNGAYEPWWHMRSDWDHNGETAVYASVGRKLDDVGLPGWHASLSYGYGWGGRAPDIDTEFREEAWAVDLSYTFQKGPLKDASLRLHYMHYDNKTDLPDWTHFKNAFQDERDIICMLIIPFGPYTASK